MPLCEPLQPASSPPCQKTLATTAVSSTVTAAVSSDPRDRRQPRGDLVKAGRNRPTTLGLLAERRQLRAGDGVDLHDGANDIPARGVRRHLFCNAARIALQLGAGRFAGKAARDAIERRLVAGLAVRRSHARSAAPRTPSNGPAALSAVRAVTSARAKTSSPG